MSVVLAEHKISQASLPVAYEGVRIVGSREELLTAAFNDGVQHMRFQRPLLTEKFRTLAAVMAKPYRMDLNPIQLQKFRFGDLSEYLSARDAENFGDCLKIIKDDFVFLSTGGIKNVHVRLVQAYPEEEIMDFHTDGEERYFCCYDDPVTVFASLDNLQHVTHSHAKLKTHGKTSQPQPGDIWKHSSNAYHTALDSDHPCLRLCGG